MRHAEPRGPNVTLWSVVAGIPRPVATWMLGVNRGQTGFSVGNSAAAHHSR